jgi:hypothetical protein
MTQFEKKHSNIKYEIDGRYNPEENWVKDAGWITSIAIMAVGVIICVWAIFGSHH